ncbi:MAG: aminodeoxychorismate/anthranilate synthase component II [Nitrososphaerota archaeon]|nr:aminodeoxychorismate/anthranilate synthase component II [Nitrososphaerales archaeon]MCX8191831.1 aminodeoxychorismate/anthranilate synthase component II [Nitrososphaerales archaeon]MDW8044174.1 aminodeoxychorismate/anthranilate synthase component II [Nitrososphaerota archaeon]
MIVLIIDNYDSFVYNLAQYFGELGAKPIVYRNDQITLERALKLKPDRIVISPGPGNPEKPRYFGICTQILQHMSIKIPTLGVCLGHQGIVHSFGGRVIRAKRVMHGKTSLIKHDGEGIFQGIKNPIQAIRYHSLVVDKNTLPECFKLTAIALDDGEIMGVRHKIYPIEGVQFHPESILTEQGKDILKNFLDGCG